MKAEGPTNGENCITRSFTHRSPNNVYYYYYYYYYRKDAISEAGRMHGLYGLFTRLSVSQHTKRRIVAVVDCNGF